ncbi:hypothetical protein [Sphingopyxis sp. 22461]|uniref:hypothetical protein n=1 Tax=Sphingopyxis sp. 22461 TaxID=3453923 RepID=UPI003F864F80
MTEIPEMMLLKALDKAGFWARPLGGGFFLCQYETASHSGSVEHADRGNMTLRLKGFVF